MQSTMIFVVGHKDFQVPSQEGYVGILAGARGKETQLAYRDDLGKNISEKNDRYCELTAEYAVWKNNYNHNANVGFVHYRRFFTQNAVLGGIISTQKFSEWLTEYDIVLPKQRRLPETVAEQYVRWHHESDLVTLRSVIEELSPEFLKSYDDVMGSNKLSCYNMFVASNEIFSDYMSWLFLILEQVEKRIDISSYDAYNRRIFGFLSERLLNVWVNAKNLKVKYCPVTMTSRPVIKRIYDEIRGK